MTAAGLIRAAPLAGPQRHQLDPADWATLADALRHDHALDFLGLWGSPGAVHAAFREGAALLLTSVPAPDGHYAALSPARPAASWHERAVADLFGLVAEGGTDHRPWLDHGRWLLATPMDERPRRAGGEPPQPEWRPPPGEDLHQYPLGPVLPGFGPAHLRLHLRGERVQTLEALLGYGHVGLLGAMLGRSPRAAARLVGRISADAAVAHGWAFARAAEAATGAEPPPRAVLLRAVMAELERLACHLSDWGHTVGMAGLAVARSRCVILREGLLRAQEVAFGSRLLLDAVVPGGVATDLSPDGEAALVHAMAAVEQALPMLQSLQDRHVGLQDRLAGAAPLAGARAMALATGGIAGRAAGRDIDLRRDMPYGPYPRFAFAMPTATTGDAEARLRLRLREMPESLGLIRAALARLEPGALLAPLPVGAGEGAAMVEGPRGDVLHWLALDDQGLIGAAFPRDAAWGHLPVLESVMAGRPFGEWPVALASLNPCLEGADL